MLRRMGVSGSGRRRRRRGLSARRAGGIYGTVRGMLRVFWRWIMEYLDAIPVYCLGLVSRWSREVTFWES
jgi:hypothetical protein